jgi:hypothetical protein
MTSINFSGLPKDMTIGEIMDIEDKLKDLPEGFKVTYQKPKQKTAEELVDELTE